MAPRVSIIVPIYNGSEFLAASVESVLAQTFTDFEVLCIDDGSTDSSAEIVTSFDDPRIRLLQHSNRGLCETLNRGFSEARTPFIARNDQDDLSDPTRIERQFEILTNDPAIGCLFTHYRKVGRKRGWTNSDKQRTTGNVRRFRGFPDGCQLASTMFARTEVLRNLGGFRQAYYPADDWDFQLRLSETGAGYILEEPLVTYRFHFGANTYPLFSTMQAKGRWAEDSHRRRTAGLQERSFADFQSAAAGNLRQRLTRFRCDLAKLQLRTAGQHYLDGDYLRAGVRGAFASLLDPTPVLHRIRTMRQR